MSARLARAIVRLGAGVLPDRGTRGRYREQWLADVDGAAELGLRPLPVAGGAALAAIRLAARPPLVAGPPAAGRPGQLARRRIGLVQLAVAAPYLWALAYYAYARVTLGVSHAELLYERAHDPKDLPAWFPLFWLYTPVMLWLAIGGWVLAAGLAPVGLLAAVGGRGAGRWLPLAGTLAGVAATALATSEMGDLLRIWLLD
jgi:hypothetical protein